MIYVSKILYPTDFSSYSNQAYFHAVALAEVHGASLTILYVYGSTGAAGRQADEERRYMREQLEQIRPTNPDIPVSHVFLEGDPAAEIVQFARDAHIDQIVMGTHGRTGVDRMLMGSVAEKVMREAPCSVMVVKLPKGQPGPAQPDLELTASR
jgi:nucleotide-binding universal stress UspA family protein